MEMEKEEAIEYLEEKGKIRERPLAKIKYNKEESKKISRVMKEGKIYGDPLVELHE